jgi:hypothetical protein
MRLVRLMDGRVGLQLALRSDNEGGRGNPWHDPRTGKFTNAPPGIRLLNEIAQSLLDGTTSDQKAQIDDKIKETGADGIGVFEVDGNLVVTFVKSNSQVDSIRMPMADSGNRERDRSADEPSQDADAELTDFQKQQRSMTGQERLDDMMEAARRIGEERLAEQERRRAVEELRQQDAIPSYPEGTAPKDGNIWHNVPTMNMDDHRVGMEYQLPDGRRGVLTKLPTSESPGSLTIHKSGSKDSFEFESFRSLEGSIARLDGYSADMGGAGEFNRPSRMVTHEMIPDDGNTWVSSSEMAGADIKLGSTVITRDGRMATLDQAPAQDGVKGTITILATGKQEEIETLSGSFVRLDGYEENDRANPKWNMLNLPDPERARQIALQEVPMVVTDANGNQLTKLPFADGKLIKGSRSWGEVSIVSDPGEVRMETAENEWTYLPSTMFLHTADEGDRDKLLGTEYEEAYPKMGLPPRAGKVSVGDDMEIVPVMQLREGDMVLWNQHWARVNSATSEQGTSTVTLVGVGTPLNNFGGELNLDRVPNAISAVRIRRSGVAGDVDGQAVPDALQQNEPKPSLDENDVELQVADGESVSEPEYQKGEKVVVADLGEGEIVGDDDGSDLIKIRFSDGGERDIEKSRITRNRPSGEPEDPEAPEANETSLMDVIFGLRDTMPEEDSITDEEIEAAIQGKEAERDELSIAEATSAAIRDSFETLYPKELTGGSRKNGNEVRLRSTEGAIEHFEEMGITEDHIGRLFDSQALEEGGYVVLVSIDKDIDVGKIRAEVRTKEGEEIGLLERKVIRGSDRVKHSYFKLQEEHANSGIGIELFTSHVEVWRETGKTDIDTFADLDVGGYFWARAGFRYTQMNGDAQINMRVDSLTDGLQRAEVNIESILSHPDVIANGSEDDIAKVRDSIVRIKAVTTGLEQTRGDVRALAEFRPSNLLDNPPSLNQEGIDAIGNNLGSTIKLQDSRIAEIRGWSPISVRRDGGTYKAKIEIETSRGNIVTSRVVPVTYVDDNPAFDEDALSRLAELLPNQEGIYTQQLILNVVRPLVSTKGNPYSGKNVLLNRSWEGEMDIRKGSDDVKTLVTYLGSKNKDVSIFEEDISLFETEE